MAYEAHAIVIFGWEKEPHEVPELDERDWDDEFLADEDDWLATLDGEMTDYEPYDLVQTERHDGTDPSRCRHCCFGLPIWKSKDWELEFPNEAEMEERIADISPAALQEIFEKVMRRSPTADELPRKILLPYVTD